MTPELFIYCVIMVIVIAWRSYYVGYNDAIKDVKATGRFPELEEDGDGD
jgi:hypothetical protein